VGSGCLVWGVPSAGPLREGTEEEHENLGTNRSLSRHLNWYLPNTRQECCFFDFESWKQQSCLLFVCKFGVVGTFSPILCCSVRQDLLACQEGPCCLGGGWLQGLRQCQTLGAWYMNGIENRPDTVPLICYSRQSMVSEWRHGRVQVAGIITRHHCISPVTK
jgi:hypothetical protein